MTVPPTPPPGNIPSEREEFVEEVVTPDQVQTRQVVRDVATERYESISRVNQVLWLMFGLMLALIAGRVVLKLIGANPAAVFAQIIYGLTDVFLWPFAGLTATPGGDAGSPGRVLGRVLARNESPARAPPREASRARWAASDSTLRTASSSDSRSRVISDSLRGGCTLRSCAISAARARSYSARRLSPGALGSRPAMARAISG